MMLTDHLRLLLSIILTSQQETFIATMLTAFDGLGALYCPRYFSLCFSIENML